MVRDGRSQQPGNFPQFRSRAANGRSRRVTLRAGFFLRLQRALLSPTLAMAMLQCLPRTNQRVSFGVDKPLDLQRQLHVAPTVKPLAGSALIGFELRKLRFPESKDVSFHPANPSNISDLEVETVWDRRCVNNALLGKLCGHNIGSGISSGPQFSL